jgi:hypothetical protein
MTAQCVYGPAGACPRWSLMLRPYLLSLQRLWDAPTLLFALHAYEASPRTSSLQSTHVQRRREGQVERRRGQEPFRHSIRDRCFPGGDVAYRVDRLHRGVRVLFSLHRALWIERAAQGTRQLMGMHIALDISFVASGRNGL